MANHRQVQIDLLQPLLDDPRLTGGAKNQIRIFIDILNSQSNVGFDTTSALFYGFLNNDDFTHPSKCPLSQREVAKARELFGQRATIPRAHESSLLRKALKLPIFSSVSTRIDLQDLAVSLLTYATTERHFTYDAVLVAPLYKYLNIPTHLHLNVYDLYHDLRELDIEYHDLIVNLSRLRFQLIPPTVKAISVVYRRLFDKVYPTLPNSLNHLSGDELEDFIMECYDKAGFTVVRVGRRTTQPDGGVDVIAYTNDLPLVGNLRVAIQCKATAGRIESSVIRGFNGSLDVFHANKGVFVAKSGFTENAISEVTEHCYPIELMDYVKLSNALRELVTKS
jgi:hypothetical protein